MAYTILIIDEEPMLTDLLSEHFRQNGYLTYTANNSAQALEQLRHKPDLILLDINIPGTNGLELCKQIRSHVVCPILFLTDHAPDQERRDIQVTEDDYIIKPFRLHELTTRIAARLPQTSPEQQASKVLTDNGLRLALSERTVFYNGVELSFSKREFDLIEFLLTHANQVFDRERLYEAVWGYDAEGNSSTVKEHIRKIRAKLKAATGRDYIETVWGWGTNGSHKCAKKFPRKGVCTFQGIRSCVCWVEVGASSRHQASST